MTDKQKNLAVLIIMVLINLANASFWALMIYPFKVIEIKSVEVLDTTVEAGDQVRLKVTGCKNFAVAASSQTKLINHYEYLLAPEVSNDLSVGCFVKEFSIPIPSYVDGGVYHIHRDLKHTIFGFRDIDTHYESPTFTVASKSGAVK